MKNLYILICVAVYLFSTVFNLKVFGYTSTTPLYTRFTYMFVHIGFVHLFMNMMSFHYLFRAVKQRINQKVIFFAMFIGAFLATYGSEMTLPTIGASGVVMFLFGSFTALYFTRSLAITIVAMVAINLLTYYFAHTNMFIHALSMGYGLIFTSIYKLYGTKDQRPEGIH